MHNEPGSRPLPFYSIIMIAFLCFGIAIVAFGKTLNSYSKEQMDSADQDPIKMDCVSKGHMEHMQMVESKDPYKRSLVNYNIPGIALTNQFGNPVDIHELLTGPQPVIMNFIYTSCTTICPVLTSGLSKTQSENAGNGVLKDVRMISVTIDPEYDTPDKLLAYSKRFHAMGDWYFLTGDTDAVVELLNAFDAYRGDKMDHIPLTFVRGKDPQKWIRIEGFPTPSEVVSEYKSIQ